MMEFTALFLSVVIVVAVSWWGSSQLALALFTVALIASVATYFHHATDVLKLNSDPAEAKRLTHLESGACIATCPVIRHFALAGSRRCRCCRD
jgi:hypothetical protein